MPKRSSSGFFAATLFNYMYTLMQEECFYGYDMGL